MVEERLAIKLGHLDLARRKSDLSDLFNSIVYKIPDLYMPPAIRLANEDDFFNLTKDIPLKPFKRQNEGFYKVFAQGSKLRKTNLKYVTTRKDVIVSQHYTPKHKCEASSGATGPKGFMLKKEKLTGHELSEDIDHQRVGFDKLLRNKPGADYPFANPMPDCMMTDDHIDNLREIIVSSLNIEWKMLTPVRPDSFYEEEYFDKLIYLHRNKYKAQLEAGFYELTNKRPFKHTRHTFLVKYFDAYKKKSPVSSSSYQFFDGKILNRFKRKFTKVEQNKSTPIQLNIPTLTLTSDEPSGEQTQKSLDIGEDGDDNETIEDNPVEFHYESFSRFSKRNLRMWLNDHVVDS